ncbi:Fizzy-related protein-like protein [Zootermopsis nevadensis]|uniref:Fizzy-related protein-like protein n=1 Tax=Zootermopsis nevadensis TaxID=136037 RepID=A0A067QGG5_ZOONE|nr:Fizzy-related protein-like protein [Zootermopsis nevadensis]
MDYGTTACRLAKGNTSVRFQFLTLETMKMTVFMDVTPCSLVSTNSDSKNHIRIWKYPNLSLVANLTGHSSGVPHLAMSPDVENIEMNSHLAIDSVFGGRCWSRRAVLASSAPVNSRTVGETLSVGNAWTNPHLKCAHYIQLPQTHFKRRLSHRNVEGAPGSS